MTFDADYDKTVPPVVKGALNVLTSASKEPSIKAVVYTSSSTAAVLPQPGKKVTVTTETWNEDTLTAAQKPGASAFEVYGASKTEAEQAFWRAIKETKPPFQAATILPNCNIGPILKPGGEMEASTASWMLKVFHGAEDAEREKQAKEAMELLPPQWYVDVQDTARLIVTALVDPECEGKRVFAFAGPFNWTEVLSQYCKLFPNKQFLDPPVDEQRDLMEIPKQEAEALLRKHYGKGFTSLEESLKELTASVQ